MSRDVSMSTAIRVNRTRIDGAAFTGVASKSKRPTHKGRSLGLYWLVSDFELRRARVFGTFREDPATI
jgi:hypothetical protein